MFQNIPCLKCGSLLVFDRAATYILYDENKGYDIEDVDTIVENAINKKIIFICKNCKNEEHIDYEEWSKRVRMYLTKKLLKDRAAVLLARFRGKGVDEASGISYCGGCFGYGGDGWCLNDIIKQCELGKNNCNVI